MNRYIFFLMLLCSCSTPPAPEKMPDHQGIAQMETILDGLRRPWSMAFLSDSIALIAEKDGDLLQVNLNNKQRFALKGFPEDLADSITLDHSLYRPGEFPRRAPNGLRTKYNAGIFQVLTDPDFQNNHHIYVSYVSQKDNDFTTKVIRAKLQNDSLTQIKTLLLALPYAPGLFHFGGGMVIGADNKLYITVGERLFSEGLEPDLPIAQDLKDQRGKIYRINLDGSIPEDNPDFGTDTPPGMYAVGIRAAQGLTLNAQTKDIWFTEHGTNQGDEINKLIPGANYGWPIITTGGYRANYQPPVLEGRSYTPPIWYWAQTVAPTGLTFYSGDEFPQWQDKLVVAGLSKGNFMVVALKDEKVTAIEYLFLDERVRLRKVIQSPDGKLFALSDEDNGRLIRIRNSKF